MLQLIPAVSSLSHSIVFQLSQVPQYSAAVNTSCLKSLTQYSVPVVLSLSIVLHLIRAVSSLSHSIVFQLSQVPQYSAAVNTSCLKSLTQYSVRCLKSLSMVLQLSQVSQYSAAVDTSCFKSLTQYRADPESHLCCLLNDQITCNFYFSVSGLALLHLPHM